MATDSRKFDRSLIARSWTAANAQREARAVQHNPNMPACPTCAAPALAGYPWANWCDLAHDCNCVADREVAYLAGLRHLWKVRTAYPSYIAALPDRYARLVAAARPEELATAADGTPRALDGSWLFIHGPAGVGKTYEACLWGAAYARAGLTVAFWSLNALVTTLRDFDAPRPDLIAPDVLILDDAGKLKPTEFAYEHLYNTLEGRWSRDRCTILTANHTPREVGITLTPGGNADAAAAIISRMGSGRVLPMTGKDRRYKSGPTLN